MTEAKFHIVDIRRLDWSDPELGPVQCPKGAMPLLAGYGSGLSIRPGDPPGIVWAVGDRGPNIKVAAAAELYGVKLPDGNQKNAKIMPRTDLGPALAELRVVEDEVELLRTVRLTSAGEPLPGVPIPGGAHAVREPALTLTGEVIEPNPSGADSEGLVAFADGTFWVGDEYGPSLLKVSEQGEVLRRWVPAGLEGHLGEAKHEVGGVLPAIAAKRQLNRGFEALTVSKDEQWLYLAFQSPLAHPDEEAHEGGRHVRLWRLDAMTGAVTAQFLYPLDPPESFRRDVAKGRMQWSDLKVSEITLLEDQALLVLERGSQTTKIYRVELEDGLQIPPEHLEIDTRPTVEELSAGDAPFPLSVLAKQLVFSTDDAPEVAADLEGMVLLSPTELLLVNDNDFGVEGAHTSFWRVRFAEPLKGG